jgi:hypothetical protein
VSGTRTTVTGAFDTLNTRIDYTRSSCVAPWVQQTVFQTYTGEQSVKTVTSVDTPSFHRLLACGGFLPLNPFHVSTVTTTRTPGVGTSFHLMIGGCYRSKTEGPYWMVVEPEVSVPEPDETLVTAAANAAIAKVKSSVFDTLTYAAELRKTASMVANNWDRINDFAMRAARRARNFRRNPKDVIRAFSGYWLEYRYGWRPAYNETLDAIKALESTIQGHDILDGKSMLTESLSDSGTRTEVSASGTATITTTITGSRKYCGMAYARVLSPDLSRFGLDPFITAYELIPYSFMVDRFIDIGTWLQAVSPFSGAKLLGSAVGVRDSYTMETTWNKIYSGAYSGSLNGIKTTVEVESYDRFPHGSDLPGWNPRITLATVVDIVALVVSGSSSVRRLLR